MERSSNEIQRLTIPNVAQETITEGQAVCYSGYVYNGTTHTDYAGIALSTIASGYPIPYARYGRVLCLTGGNFTQGAKLGFDSTGRVVAVASGIGGLVGGKAFEANASGGAGIYIMVDLLEDSLESFESPAFGKVLFVDSGRTDSYTSDGSFLKPFKTITAALTQIITNADNSATVPYKIVISNKNYTEDIDLDSTALVNIEFYGQGKNQTYLSGDITNDADNDAVVQFKFSNMTLTGAISFTGESTATEFGNLVFNNCLIVPAAGIGTAADKTLTVNNVSYLYIIGDTEIYQNVSITNVIGVYLDGVVLYSNTNTYTLVTNTGGNIPSGYTGITVNVRSGIVQVNPTHTITAGTIHTNCFASKYGASDNALTLPDGATITYYNRSRIGIVYDFATHGGAVSSISTGLIIPDNTVITGGAIDVLTTFTSPTSDAATIALTSNSAGDLVTAIAISDASNVWDAGLHGVLAGNFALDGDVFTAIKMAASRSASWIKTTANRELTVTIAGEAVTAGKMLIELEIIPSL